MFNMMKYLAMKFKFKQEDELQSDCYSACRIIAKDRGKILPKINYINYHLRQTHFLISKEMKKTKVWKKVKPKEDTIVAFRLNGAVSHVGYMINETEFFHIQKTVNAKIDSINNPLWKTCMVGCYEYIGE